VKITAEIELPKIPNHLRLTNGSSIPIEAITEAELKALGKLWTAALIERAAERRKGEAVAAPEVQP